MAANVIMPALGLAQESGKVLRWLKSEGEAIAKGEPLIEIETDKITVEIEAPASGILANVTAVAGDVVPVGQVIAVIRAPGEAPSEPPAALGGSTATAPKRPVAPVPTSLPFESAARAVSPARPHASPKARRLARERGVDISSLPGTGPSGAIVADDVLRAEGTSGPPSAGQLLTVSAAWRLMAERTTLSWTSAPHIFLLREINASRLITWREKYQKRFKVELTYTDLLVKLVAVALRDHPRLNGRWDDSRIILNPEINVGLAVAVEDGLVVPVIHRADTLTVSEIAARRKDLVTRAQTGILRPEDIRGGTFTVSNLGMYGVDAFTAILNPPQAAILAVGRIADRVVPVDGRPGVQPMMILSLSCDHRMVDGARGARFLDTLAELIEEPLVLLGGS